MGGSCPGQTGDPEQPGRSRFLWPMVSLGKREQWCGLVLRKEGAVACACCFFWKCRYGEEKNLARYFLFLFGRVIITYQDSTDHECLCQHAMITCGTGMPSLTVGEPPSKQHLLPTRQLLRSGPVPAIANQQCAVFSEVENPSHRTPRSHNK